MKIEVQDQIYKGTPAAVLGKQLDDIRTVSRPNQFKPGEVSEARSRLEQTQRRHEAINKRAAGTGGLTVGIPSDGGFFLQTETAVDLIQAGTASSEVLSRCDSRTLERQAVDLVGIDETSRQDGYRHGGIRVYTTAELEAFSQSKAQFAKCHLEPKKLTGLFFASDEMDSLLLGQEMRKLFAAEYAFKCTDQVINGTGAGEGLGILKAGCKIQQAKENGQTAKTITAANVLKMESQLSAEGPNVVYLIGREAKPQIQTLSISIGTAGQLVPLYKTYYDQGKRIATLNGFPCITTEQAGKLGDEGDIILADLSQYVTANKGDVDEAMSIHVYFLYAQNAYRFVYYFDGQPRWATSITPYKGASGAKVSPFITLEARTN